MSTGNLFNTNIEEAVIAEVIAKLDEAEALLEAHYVSLSNSDKRQIPKMADETQPFAEKTIEFMKNEPTYNPPYVSIPETEKDFANHIRVRPLREKLQGMAQKVTDIGIVAGSDTLVQTLAYYNSVARAAQMGVPGAQEIYNELRKRFLRTSDEEPTDGGEAPPEGDSPTE